MTLNEYFPKIFCINLERRKDRWEECEKEFAKHNLIVERVEAVDGDTLELDRYPVNKNAYACSLSHLKVLEAIIEQNLSSALIIEDDVEFIPNLQEFFSACNIPKWDMLYLGINHQEPPIFEGQFAKINKGYTTCAYAVTNEMAQVLKKEVGKKDPIDVTYTKFHKVYNCYAFSPQIAWQKPGHSDIEGTHQDYEAMKPDEHKTTVFDNLKKAAQLSGLEVTDHDTVESLKQKIQKYWGAKKEQERVSQPVVVISSEAEQIEINPFVLENMQANAKRKAEAKQAENESSKDVVKYGGKKPEGVYQMVENFCTKDRFRHLAEVRSMLDENEISYQIEKKDNNMIAVVVGVLRIPTTGYFKTERF